MPPVRDEHGGANTAFAPFRHPIYRAIWTAQFVGNIGTWAQTVGGQWLMGDLGGHAFEVSLVQTASTLPVFLLVLPAGSLGDIIDRRRLLLIAQSIMLAASGLLAVLTFAHATTPAVLLLLTAVIGGGTALQGPTFSAIQPELVTRDEVGDAALLNGASVNIARTVGPAIAGLLIGSIGIGATFTLNAISFAAVMAALLAWKRPRDRRPLNAEHLREAFVTGVRYTRSAPAFQAVLGRSLLFIFFASALWSLLAVLARGPLDLGASGYGVLLGAVGVGAVFGTLVVVPRVRNLMSTGALVACGSLLYGVGLVIAAVSDSLPLTIVTLLFVGLGWISVTSMVNAHAQLLLPNWTRARALAFMNVAFQGGQAVGSVIWGVIAGAVSTRAAFGIAGVGEVIGAVIGYRLLPLATLGDVESATYWPEPNLEIDVEPGAGPVLVTLEWRIDPKRAGEFTAAMEEVRQTRRQTGATRWGLYQDADDLPVFLETFTVDTWSEHLRQHLERGTVMDEEIEAEARRFLVDGEWPHVRHLLWAYRP